MEVRDLKYLFAYAVPGATFLALANVGWWSYATVVLAFVIVPFMDEILHQNTSNLTEDEVIKKSVFPYFDILLYCNLVFVYVLLGYFIFKVQNFTLSAFEVTGLILSVGIMLSSNGINVAHELGHKSGNVPQIAAKLLLLPSLYMHFIIEHNYGHHLRVGTPEDPATSRYNENIFAFWWRSVSQSFMSACAIEANRLKKKQKHIFSINNQIFRFLIYQLLYILAIAIIFNLMTAFILIAASVTSILLLESINYIEHYGLVRRVLPNGRYETVDNFHSWNSDHEAGRILLYELTRHSDHHYKANKKYQILNHFDESPQLPYGYPASIVLALIPPLWFKTMNPKVNEWRQYHIEN